MDQSLRGADPMAGAKAAVPMTRLQSRIQDEVQMHHEVTAKRRDQGDPMGQPEIERELTMCVGALEGVYQRVGALAAVLGPIMPGDIHLHLTGGPGRVEPTRDEFPVETEVGQRIRSIQRQISEIEDAIGTIAANVRL